MRDHDVKPGPLEHCQICGSANLRLLIDLGYQPLCDALVTKEKYREVEPRYPLHLMQCEECSLAQLDYVVAGSEVYPADYPYRAGISWPVVQAHRQMAQSIVNRFGAGFCMDIGSNDGTLLSVFQKLGCAVIGFEPTDIADIARKNGVPTVKEVFTEACAVGVLANEGPAHVITMTNVFAHMASLGEVMRGVCATLADDGVLVIENHYLLDILEKNQFDSIYHEHIRTYTLKSLIHLFAQYGLEVFDVERVPRYGGNIRVFVGWKHSRQISPSVNELLVHEAEVGLDSPVVWDRFVARVQAGRDHFMNFARGRGMAACSAPGRASTLLNYYGVTTRDISYTGEIPGSLKIGKFIPGCRIEILPNTLLLVQQPEFIVLLAWHYADEIAHRLRREGVRSTLVVPLPELKFRGMSDWTDAA